VNEPSRSCCNELALQEDSGNGKPDILHKTSELRNEWKKNVTLLFLLYSSCSLSLPSRTFAELQKHYQLAARLSDEENKEPRSDLCSFPRFQCATKLCTLRLFNCALEVLANLAPAPCLLPSFLPSHYLNLHTQPRHTFIVVLPWEWFFWRFLYNFVYYLHSLWCEKSMDCHGNLSLNVILWKSSNS